MEFSTTILAAILTIIGYSINDTIVVLDRVREDMQIIDTSVKKFTEILDRAQTEILSRTIFTTFTTMLAVVALYIFTTGSMKDFALALIIGMISGVYSTIYITGAFIALTRRNWKAGMPGSRKTKPVSTKDANVVQFPNGAKA
jgi:preprotein translocase subunit SecF